MFLMGFFWKPTTAAAAMFATIGGFVGSIILTVLPTMMDLSILAPIGFAVPNAAGVYEIPFLDRMLIVFVLVVIGMVVISKLFPKTAREAGKQIEVDGRMFKVQPGFAIGSTIICLGLVAIYAVWW
jgi:SSS family solute:Na+ symporter